MKLSFFSNRKQRDFWRTQEKVHCLKITELGVKHFFLLKYIFYSLKKIKQLHYFELKFAFGRFAVSCQGRLNQKAVQKELSAI